METVWGTYYSYLAVVDLAQLRENTEYIKTQKHPKLSLKYAKCLKVHSFTVYILGAAVFDQPFQVQHFPTLRRVCSLWSPVGFLRGVGTNA